MVANRGATARDYFPDCRDEGSCSATGSYRIQRAKDGRDLARQLAAIAVRQSNLCASHLTRARFPPQLSNGFDQREDAVHAGMAVAEPAAAG